LHWYRLQDIQDSQRYLSRGRACIFEVQVIAFIHNAYLVQTSWHIYRSWIVFTPGTSVLLEEYCRDASLFLSESELNPNKKCVFRISVIATTLTQ